MSPTTPPSHKNTSPGQEVQSSPRWRQPLTDSGPQGFIHQSSPSLPRSTPLLVPLTRKNCLDQKPLLYTCPSGVTDFHSCSFVSEILSLLIFQIFSCIIPSVPIWYFAGFHICCFHFRAVCTEEKQVSYPSVWNRRSIVYTYHTLTTSSLSSGLLKHPQLIFLLILHFILFFPQ